MRETMYPKPSHGKKGRRRRSPYLAEYYARIKKTRGSGKAIIALARKFLGIIYKTLKNDWVFSDFPNFVLAEEAAES